jgi:hypothetical protein
MLPKQAFSREVLSSSLLLLSSVVEFRVVSGESLKEKREYRGAFLEVAVSASA